MEKKTKRIYGQREKTIQREQRKITRRKRKWMVKEACKENRSKSEERKRKLKEE